MLDAERERLAAAARRVAEERLVIGTAGNLSARAGELVLVTPSGAALSELEPGDLAVVTLAGEHLQGERASSELGLHLGIYARYDAGAVVHTHSSAATALGCTLDELPVVHYQLMALGGPVRVAPYATFGTPELVEHTLVALQGRSAALLANHGAVVHAGDVEAAVERALLLEWACELYSRAAAIGTPRLLSAEQRRAVVAAAIARGHRSLIPEQAGET